MKKFNSRNKFQFLNVDNFEIILKFLNFDDLPNLLRACEKSKSNYLRQTMKKIFQTFHKNQIQKLIEYVSSEMFHAKQLKKNSVKFFEKYLNLKTISLPKFVKHVIQTPHFRIVTHIDGFFSIEQKLKKQKQYSIVNVQDLISQRFSTDLGRDSTGIELLNLIFSSKHFITLILNHHNNICILFQNGEIFICGKTGKTRVCFQKTKLHPISFFISENKTYLMLHIETSDTFVVFHIFSGKIFCFKNLSLKSIFLNPNSKLDYEFLKTNGESFQFVNSKDYLYHEMMCHISEKSHLLKLQNSIKFY